MCSFCSFLCSFLLSLSLFSILLFSTLRSIPCSFFSLCLFTLFSDLPYHFLFKTFIISFLFSYYSVLSASPLCSITIQSALFLLVFIFLDPSICYFFAISFALASVFFILLLFGKDLCHFPFCVPFFLSLFSLSLYSLFVLFMFPFCFCSYSLTFSVLFSPLSYATPTLIIDLLILPVNFIYLFIYLFIITIIIFLVLYFICLVLLLLSTD